LKSDSTSGAMRRQSYATEPIYLTFTGTLTPDTP